MISKKHFNIRHIKSYCGNRDSLDVAADLNNNKLLFFLDNRIKSAFNNDINLFPTVQGKLQDKKNAS